jgi:hypothetical protein
MWLDSIEKLFANNLHDDAESFLKLETCEKQLLEEKKVVDATLMTFHLMKTNNDHLPYTDHICILMFEIQKKRMVTNRRNNIVSELYKSSLKKNDVLKARHQMEAIEFDFSSPTLFKLDFCFPK